MVSGMKDGIQRWSAINAGTLTAETLTSAGYTEAQAQAYLNGALAPWSIALLVIGMLALIAFIVFINDAERRIPVQYAKRIVGNKQYGGVRQYIPLKINAAGVMPIIFAQALMFIPMFFSRFEATSAIGTAFSDYRGFWYNLVFGLLVVAFTYFYTAITVNPNMMAEDMKRNGGFIPGVKPGKKTVEYLDTIMTRITLPGSIFLAIVAILPAFAMIIGINDQFALFYGSIEHSRHIGFCQ